MITQSSRLVIILKQALTNQKNYETVYGYVLVSCGTWYACTLYTLNSVNHAGGNQSARDIEELRSVSMDAWYKRISVAYNIMESHKVNLAVITIIIMTLV